MDWSTLVGDLLMDIGRWVLSTSVEDFMAFRGVCTTWRTAVRSRHFIESVKSWPAVPFLMLGEKEGSDDREFYSLSKRRVCMRLPLAEAKGRTCLESRFGWLVTIGCSGETELLNPYTRARIQLPSLKSFPTNWDPESFCSIRDPVLTANPSDTGEFVLVVRVSNYLVFWRNGDPGWTRIEMPSNDPDGDPDWWVGPGDPGWPRGNFCYKGNFCVLSHTKQIWVWDRFDFTAAPCLIKPDLINFEIPNCSYLVESSAGDLILACRCGQPDSYCVHIFKIDVNAEEIEKIYSLGEDAMFIGENAFICTRINSNDDAVMPNVIYFYDLANFDGWEMGTIAAGLGGLHDSIERFGVEAKTPPLWVAPFAWLR